jgi:hypothetical protein
MLELKYPIPPGSVSHPCAGCGEPIYWIKTKAGASMPLNPDGTSHFATCPKADLFRREEDPAQQHFDFEEIIW